MQEIIQNENFVVRADEEDGVNGWLRITLEREGKGRQPFGRRERGRSDVERCGEERFL